MKALNTLNLVNFNDDLKNHTHEEADTLMILHAVDVTKRDPFTQLFISCSDTDVFLLLIHYYDELCTGGAYHALGDVNSAALLGFHSFTGCDQTGKFNGYSKLSCWKTLTKFKPTVLEAFKNIGEGTPDKHPQTL